MLALVLLNKVSWSYYWWSW